MRILSMLLLFTTFEAFSQTRYTVKGFYSEPGKTSPIPYTVNWVENGGDSKGLYKDNSLKESIPVSIVRSDRMRIIQVPLEKTVTFITTLPSENIVLKNVPVSVTLTDTNKNVVAASMIESSYLAELPQAQEARQEMVMTPCREGFGNLAGFCGSYQGMVVEEQDTSAKCNLTATGTLPRLELSENGEVSVRVATQSASFPNPIHTVGRIPVEPTKSTVDIMSRACRPLDGTSFKGDDCKRLNVTGEFSSSLNNTPHFFGTYVITDEKTNERCQYRFSLDRTST